MSDTSLVFNLIGRDFVSGVVKTVGLGFEGLKGKMVAGAGAVSLASGLVGIEAVKMGSSFEQQMTRINTQVGVSKGNIKGLSDGVLGLAGQVGFSPDSLAEALYHVESANKSMGMSSKQALEITKIAAEGARVGGSDLIDTTNALNAAVVSGIPGVQNMDQAMGVLNATVGAGDMHMQDLAEAIGTGVLPMVKGYGVTFDDAGAALAVFGDNNIRGADAGTALRMSVQALAKPVKGSTEWLNKLGLSQDTLAKDMQKGGLKLAINDLNKHMKDSGVTAKEQGQILTDVFGKKAGVGLNILLGQVDRFNSKYPEMEKGANGFGKAWKTQTQTTAQKFAQLKASIEASMIKLGIVLIPIAKKILDVITGIVNFISQHSGFMIPLFLAVTSLAFAITGVALAVKAWQVATMAYTGVQWALNAAMEANPVVLITLAIIALVAIIVVIATKTDWFQKLWSGAWGLIKGAISAVFGWIKKNWPLILGILTGPMGLAVAMIITHWSTIKKGVQAACSWIVSHALTPLKNFFVSTLPGAALTLWHGLSSAFGKVKSSASDAYSYVHGKFNSLVSFFKSMPGKIASATRGLFDGVKNAFRSAINWLIGKWNGFSLGFDFKIPVIGKHISFSVGTPNLPFLAKGGIATAAGLAMVGEKGPEVISMSKGAQVTPLSRSTGNSGGGGPLHVTLKIGEKTLGELVIDPLRQSVRVRGGDVQAVLGN